MKLNNISDQPPGNGGPSERQLHIRSQIRDMIARTRATLKDDLAVGTYQDPMVIRQIEADLIHFEQRDE